MTVLGFSFRFHRKKFSNWPGWRAGAEKPFPVARLWAPLEPRPYPPGARGCSWSDPVAHSLENTQQPGGGANGAGVTSSPNRKRA